MTTPRRRLVRPAAPPAPRPPTDRRTQKLRSRLEAERVTLARWMARLRRAFHAVEKSQRRVSRFERQIAQTEEL
jgi:hypothetical protein